MACKRTGENKIDALVSVIIPVYNVEKYIKKCLDSVLKQTYKNLEIIVVNDGTDEDEEAIILGYAEKDRRINYIKKERNEGLFAARITGVEESRGDYIQFVDGDDYINIDFIRLMVEQALIEDADIVFGKTVTCTTRGSETVYTFQEVERYRLPLEGADLREVYFTQHGSAYLWHTIWNKLYKRKLWEDAIPSLKMMDRKLVMTEDIAFSSVLYYYAKKAVRADNAVYFYCRHSDAATDSNKISLSQYRKRLSDVRHTFDFLRDFYADKEYKYRELLDNFRTYYGRMWLRIADEMEEEEDRGKALALCRKFYTGEILSVSSVDDNYFCYMETPYSKRLDEIKERIIYGRETIISFDVFDTTIVRPFFRPEDLFYLLDKKFEELTDSNSSFFDIRTKGEMGCREILCGEKCEDVSLDDIYDYIEKTYMLSSQVCWTMKLFELELELSFSKRRSSVYELYKLALSVGKRVIFTSDMYLSKGTIEEILQKNGYEYYDEIFVSSDYKLLKRTGNLYRSVLNAFNIRSDELLHIGDSMESDVRPAEKLGIATLHFPKTKDAFCGKSENISNRNRIGKGKEIGGSYRGDKTYEKLSAYGACVALAANRFFDNSLIGFNDFTDFNVDAYFTGYYTLGMCLIAQITWLENVIKANNLGRVVFTSRDGYLLMQAYRKYLKITHREMETMYMYVSRRSMLPWMLKERTDFLDLPIVFQKYTPRLIDELLDFCINHDEDYRWEKIVKEEGFNIDETFMNIHVYQKYMNLFLKRRYCFEAHEKAKGLISSYCKMIKADDGIYDLGYSGAIHKAICDASNCHPTALFIHSDADKHLKNVRRGKFVMRIMMDTTPNITGLMREFFFSSTEGSCIGYKVHNEEVVPVIEDEKRNYTDTFPIYMMQKGALQMVEDYYGLFNRYLSYLDVRVDEMMMPFEGFLSSPSPIDTKMFIASYFEDKVYGKLDKINVRDFWTQILLGSPGYKQSDMIHYFSDLLQKYGKKKLAFFGTGKMCEAMFEDNPNIPVDIFLDNNRQKSGMKYKGRTVVHPSDYPELKELYIVVAIAFYKEVEEQLRDMGLTKYDDYLNYLELF